MRNRDLYCMDFNKSQRGVGCKDFFAGMVVPVRGHSKEKAGCEPFPCFLLQKTFGCTPLVLGRLKYPLNVW